MISIERNLDSQIRGTNNRFMNMIFWEIIMYTGESIKLYIALKNHSNR